LDRATKLTTGRVQISPLTVDLIFIDAYNLSMYRRNITNSIIEALSDTPVILVNGARQTGKSTLCERIREEGAFEGQFVTMIPLLY
jgi:polynucleotide 5'-kinase involved in rRNA processing